MIARKALMNESATKLLLHAYLQEPRKRVLLAVDGLNDEAMLQSS